MARPTKLTDEVQAKIVQAIVAGNYLETAAAFAGVDRKTIRIWIRDGSRQTKGRKRDFYEAVMQAQAESEVRAVVTLAQSKDWKAHAFRLARRFPDRWASTSTVRQEIVDLRQDFRNASDFLKKAPDEALALAEAYETTVRELEPGDDQAA